jgi:glycyl-tRNA synthetase
MSKQQSQPDLMDKVVNLAKRRGFIFPGSEIYGGLANSWDYGPLGVELKNNIKKSWWKKFVQERSDVVGIDAAIIMNPKIWKATGHVDTFNDPLVEDKKTHERYRLDHLLESNGIDVSNMNFDQMVELLAEKNIKSPNGNELGDPKQFNMMLKTHLGPVEDENSLVYLRPETAQAMFADFKHVQETSRMKVPFGIAQIGKSFRNEITPGNFIFRTREFEQMEMEYFIKEGDWEKQFEYWLDYIKSWLRELGLKDEDMSLYEHGDEERSFYSKRTVDVMYRFPFGVKELYGLAYRSDYDLSQHQKFSGKDLSYLDPITNERYLPHVIEPAVGLDRTLLCVLLSAYAETEARSGKDDAVHDLEVTLRLPKDLAPIKVAVLPLSKKEELTGPAKEILKKLQSKWMCQYDETGSIGKRYRRQDEIGTPYCLTIDFETANDQAVTVRDRDTMQQERVKVEELLAYFQEKLHC